MLNQKMTVYGIITFLLLLLSGCGGKEGSVDDALSLLDTQVFYLEGTTLPKDAELLVRLEDISKMDVAAQLIARAARKVSNVPPYNLQIVFPTKLIKMNRSYNLHASIRANGVLLFVSTTRINPFEVGIASPIQVQVEQVAK